jgi:hypothetical protein
MTRIYLVILLVFILASFIVPVSLEAQHHGGGGRSGGGAGVRSAPSLTGRPVTPFVNPPVNAFGRAPHFGSRPIGRSRPIVVAPIYGYGGLGYYPGYYQGYYPYDYSSPYYPAPAVSEPYYSEPQQAYSAPAGDQNAADLSYQMGVLSQQIQDLRQQQAQAAQQAQPAPAPMSAPVVLIFKDGRRTEIQNYAIIGQTLWVLDERNSTKVPLADLDLEATQRENRSRGFRFSLPGQ